MLKPVRPLLASLLFLPLATPLAAQDRPQIIAVNKVLQQFAERLVGETADSIFPVPEGVDPSFWRPSIADISTIQSADLILLNGAGFATWIDRVSLPRSRVVNTSAAIEDQFIITESITHSHGDGGEHSHEGLASYTWLDPMLAIAQAEAIASAVSARNLAPDVDVNARLEGLRSELNDLDETVRDTLIGLEGVTLIATHPRYQYFARRYDLPITSLEWEAGAMPTEAELDALASLVSETGAYILIWEAMPPAGAFELTTELGVENVVFAPYAQGATDLPFAESVIAAAQSIATAAAAGQSN